MERQKLLSLTKNDFEFQTFRAGGAGGQHQNKTDSAVRCIHKKTSLNAECRKHRSQYRNKQEAFKKLCDNKEFRKWIKIESMKIAGLMKSSEQIKREVELMIERGLKNGDIKIEYLKNNGVKITT